MPSSGQWSERWRAARRTFKTSHVLSPATPACFQMEVEWVLNCLSAADIDRTPLLSHLPTARGVMKAAEVLGVRDSVRVV